MRADSRSATGSDPARLVDQDTGLISSEVYSDDLHSLEMERVFGNTWLFVGHESMLPKPRDYVTNYMGEDAIIVTRDDQNAIHVLLNKCRHRGNKVCLFDRGRAPSFICSYHGWSYAPNGTLVGVPRFDAVYEGDLVKEDWGLKEAVVGNYGGLLFATWSDDPMPLETYLGDARWYLETYYLEEDMGGIEFLHGKQRYRMPVNWKLLTENFAGDQYHFFVTHASLLKLTTDARWKSKLHAFPKEGVRAFSVLANYRTGVPHGLLELRVGETIYEHELAAAKPLGKEAVEWVEERYRRLQERLKHFKAKPYGLHVGSLFPNFSFIGGGTALEGNAFYLWHPRGARETEVWQWCAVNKDAPDVIRRRQREGVVLLNSAAGMIAPDDHENFERMTQNLRTTQAKRLPFNYAMGLSRDDAADPRPPEWQTDAWPGKIAPEVTEAAQREFYRYWTQLMGRAETAPRA